MNTQIEQVIEEIRKNEEEIMHLYEERAAIMKEEKHLSRANFQREMAIVENFIQKELEKLANNRSIVENYNANNNSMALSAPDNSQAENETSTETQEVEATPNEEIEINNEERLKTLQAALDIARNSYEASVENFNKIFENERNEISERGPISNEELEELNNRYFRAKEEENQRLQNSRNQIIELESRINKLNETIEQERSEQELKQNENEVPEIETALENNADPLHDLKLSLLQDLKDRKITHNEMIEKVQEAAGNLRKKENDEYTPIPVEKSLVPITPEEPEIKEEEYTPIPVEKSLVPVEDEKSLVPVEKSNDETVEKQTDKEQRGLYTIINELTADLNVQKGTGKKYRASNIKVSKEFKEELKSGNYLYNIVHLVPAIIKVPIKLIKKAINRIKYSIEEKKTVSILKDRISNLDEADLKVIWEEYRGSKVISERNPDILNILLNERMQQYALEKVAELNSSMEKKYQELFESKKVMDKCNEILSEISTDDDKELIQEVINTRENAISGKAEMIKKLREEYKEANLWLSGGAHGFEEDLKAATTKLSIVGKRFAKEQDLDHDIAKKQAELEQREIRAINNHDDEEALNAFVESETLLSSNTKIEQSIFGNRSTGAKYYEPLVEKSNYNDDPFIRDLFTTVAVSAATISAVSALNVHGNQAEILKNHQDEVAQVNTNNDAIINNVNEQGAKLVDNGNDFAEGMQVQAEDNIVNHTNTMERQTLDQASWQTGSSSYRAADNAAHEMYNGMSDSVQERINDIANQYSSGITSREATLDMLKDVANETQQNLVDLYEAYLPTLKEYASSHPQFDLHGVEEAMEFVTSHPGAIAKMNDGMVESVQIGENLSALSAEHIEAINSLPSDLRTTLFADGAAAVALAYNVSKNMNANAQSGKYGNSVTEMVSKYIEDKANEDSNPTITPVEESTGKSK